MIRITDIIDKIYDYYPDADIDIVDRAYIYSAKVHDGQLRLSGEPYLSHPLEVASLLADMRLDTTSIACGLLHGQGTPGRQYPQNDFGDGRRHPGYFN